MKLVGIARLGADPEVRQTATGDAFATLRLAYNYGKKDENNQRPTQWLNVTAWGQSKDTIMQYMKKGSAALFYLRDVRAKMYVKQDGTNDVSLEATVDSFEMLPRASNEPAQPSGFTSAPQPSGFTSAQYANKGNPKASMGGVYAQMEDDIPF